MNKQELQSGRGLAVDETERLFHVTAEPVEGAVLVAVGDHTAVLTVASARFLIEAVSLAVGELSEALGNKYDCCEVKQRVLKGDDDDSDDDSDVAAATGWPPDSDIAGLPREPGGSEDWRTEVTKVDEPGKESGKHPRKPAHRKR